MVEKRSWEEFRSSGLLWFANRILHTFGWAIVVEVDSEDSDKVVGCYPARVKFRGFGLESEENGFIKVTKYMQDNANQLLEEAMMTEENYVGASEAEDDCDQPDPVVDSDDSK